MAPLSGRVMRSAHTRGAWNSSANVALTRMHRQFAARPLNGEDAELLACIVRNRLCLVEESPGTPVEVSGQ